MVLMEATSAGLPIVATDVGGMPQVITDGADGLIVPAGNAVEMAAALERLTDTTLRLNLAAGAKEKSAMFDVSSASRQVEAIYRLVAAAGR